MAATESPIVALPNEILISILSSFSTRQLLPLVLASHRFHALILRILQTRLFNATSLKDHKLIFQCHHPSTKLLTPYLFCEYLGTGPCHSASADLEIDAQNAKQRGLGELKEIYSHLRPLQPEEENRERVRSHPAGGLINSIAATTIKEKEMESVEQPVHLKSHELFGQLCTVTNLLKVAPKRGLLLSIVNIGEGITRMWRDWLSERCAALKRRDRLGSGPNTKEKEDEEFKKRLLWADTGNQVGLQIRVVDREEAAGTVLVGRKTRWLVIRCSMKN